MQQICSRSLDPSPQAQMVNWAVLAGSIRLLSPSKLGVMDILPTLYIGFQSPAQVLQSLSARFSVRALVHFVGCGRLGLD